MRPNRHRSLSVAAFVVIAIAALAFPAIAAAAAVPPAIRSGTPFPRLGMIWPNAWKQSLDDLARYDYVVLWRDAESKVAPLKARHADMLVLTSTDSNARQMDDFQGASPRWLLTQVGSTLAAETSAQSATMRVAEITKSGKTLFAAGDYIVIDSEICEITDIDGLELTVTRGYGDSSPAAHAAGSRIAAGIEIWPGALVFDLTDKCPKVDVGHGAETWREFNARTSAALVNGTAWDGLFYDDGAGWKSYLISAGLARTIDPDRSNTVVSSYSAFDTAWNAGLVAQEAALRSRIQPGKLVFGNWNYPDYANLNGCLLEGFPNDSGSKFDRSWETVFLGGYPGGSYMGWDSRSLSPDLTTIETYEHDDMNQTLPARPNYRKMRFGLTTALMGDGYFSYEVSTKGHGSNGLLWFDEYDNAGAGRGYLGLPTSDPRAIVAPSVSGDLLGGRGDFAASTNLSAWRLYAATGAAASASLDSGAACIGVTRSDGVDSKVSFSRAVPVTAGKAYKVTFRARADRSLNIYGSATRDSWPYEQYFNSGAMALGTEWKTYEFSAVSAAADPAALCRFDLGESVGTIWLDDVQVQETQGPPVWRRYYENGIALVNPSGYPATIQLGGTFRKIKGTQAPTINDGSLVTAVTLAPKDGLVLLAVDDGPAPGPVTGGSPTLTPVYRFYNVAKDVHFYTASAAERDKVLATLSSSYTYEGVAYIVNGDNPANRTPLYRFYNVAKDVHFYTASAAERDNVIATLGGTYRYEGVAYNVSTDPTGATPVYRFYNRGAGTHFYTASAHEKDTVMANMSGTYTYEGVAFYLAP